MTTDAELDQYGAGLSIWEQIRLFQEWAPLVGFAQRFTSEPDAYRRSVIVAEALEWVASKTKSQLDNELVTRVVAIAKTREGEEFIRWALSKAGAA
jgi:hypothetical protein